MSIADEPKVLQVTGTLVERLNLALGQLVTVYLMGVHAPPIVTGPGACPPYPPGTLPPPQVGAGGAWAGPPLTPGIPPGGGHVAPIQREPMMLDWVCPPRPPCPEPEPEPMLMGTATVTGTLGFVGADYLIIRVAVNSTCVDILIPYAAIGMIVFPPVPV